MFSQVLLLDVMEACVRLYCVCVCVCVCVCAVSYTHLDVYKRQSVLYHSALFTSRSTLRMNELYINIHSAVRPFVQASPVDH